MKKRLLSILLTLALALGMLPAAALAADAPTATVSFTAQAEGAFLIAPQTSVAVSGDLAERYGYTDSVTNGVSALDVLVRVHELLLDSGFTPGNDQSCLAVSNTGFVTTIFGEETSASGFLLNGGYPTDGTESSDGPGYNGTTVTTQAVTDGDQVDFFLYQDSYCLDNIAWFCRDGAAVDTITVRGGASVPLTLRGTLYMAGYLYPNAGAMHDAVTDSIEDAQLAWVDAAGTLTDIPGAVTNESGAVTLTAPDEEGTYYLTAYATAGDIEDGANPLVMSLTKVIVDNSAPPVETVCQLTALSVASFASNPASLTMTPVFDGAVAFYTVPTVAYAAATYERTFYVKAGAPDGAVITARLNGGEWKPVTSGDATWTVIGNLTPGKNTLEVQVAASDAADAQTKTYTVSVLMAPDPAAAANPTAVMHNIAAKYAQSGLVGDENAPWLAADMAAYAQAFPDTNNRLSAAQVQACLDKFIAGADQHTTPGDLAKDIIAIRALGYDARKVVTSDRREIDVVKKLTDLVDARDTAVSNPYTLPYVLIALQQDSGYATQAQLDWLIQKALDTQSSWQSTSWGTDGATPMMLALAPYYESNADVKAAVNAAAEAVKAKQNEDGSVGSSNQASSTGLAMAAFAALGQDPVTAGGKHLADGLMAYVTDSKDGFQPAGNTFATEQGFRGLVAQALNGRVYDFTSLPMETARATYVPTCPVEFTVIPNDAAVVVKQGSTVQKPAAGAQYNLAAGSYTYTVSKAGYTTVTGSFEVTADEAAAHTPKPISVSLTSAPGGDARDITVTVKVLTHDSAACGGSYTYKYNQSAYTVTLAEQTVTLKAGQSPFDALAKALAAAGLSYSEKSYGYIDAIGAEAEFGHGSAHSGWQYMVNGTLPEIGCRDYAFTGDATLIWFFTDDYTRERGSEIWGGGGGTSTPVTEVEKTFTDISGHWSVDAIQYVYDRGLMEGVGETTFAPHATLSRSMLVTMLWRLAGKPAAEGSAFADVPEGEWYAQAVAWAAAQGIVDGMTATTFAPDGVLSREQAAAMLYRYAQSQNYATGQRGDLAGYADGAQVSGWAVDAMQWANGASLMTGRTDAALVPGGSATRAEAAAILMRFCENVAK